MDQINCKKYTVITCSDMIAPNLKITVIDVMDGETLKDSLVRNDLFGLHEYIFCGCPEEVFI